MILLLPDTVSELCCSQHLVPDIVIAGHSSSNSSEILETILLLDHIRITTRQLGHLYLEAIRDIVIDREGEGGRVVSSRAEVQIGMKSSVYSTQIRIVPICSWSRISAHGG